MQVHGAPAAVFRCNVSIFIKAGDRAKKREMKKKSKKKKKFRRWLLRLLEGRGLERTPRPLGLIAFYCFTAY